MEISEKATKLNVNNELPKKKEKEQNSVDREK
jgi:hypothetical protein